MAFLKNKKFKSDAFMGAKSIIGLQEETFENYITEQDVALVMFYHPKQAYSQFSKSHFAKAAKVGKKENVTYAAVNCEDEGRLCAAENVKFLPYFKIYSRGSVVNEQGMMTDYRKIVQVANNATVLPPKPVSKTLFSHH